MTDRSTYVLIDPICFEVRYVGSTYSPMPRKSGHFAEAKLKPHTAKNAWINNLAEKGLRPVFKVISREDIERDVIIGLKSCGASLFNKNIPYQRHNKFFEIFENNRVADTGGALDKYKSSSLLDELKRRGYLVENVTAPEQAVEWQPLVKEAVDEASSGDMESHIKRMPRRARAIKILEEK